MAQEKVTTKKIVHKTHEKETGGIKGQPKWVDKYFGDWEIGDKDDTRRRASTLILSKQLAYAGPGGKLLVDANVKVPGGMPSVTGLVLDASKHDIRTFDTVFGPHGKNYPHPMNKHAFQYRFGPALISQLEKEESTQQALLKMWKTTKFKLEVFAVYRFSYKQSEWDKKPPTVINVLLGKLAVWEEQEGVYHWFIHSGREDGDTYTNAQGTEQFSHSAKGKDISKSVMIKWDANGNEVWRSKDKIKSAASDKIESAASVKKSSPPEKEKSFKIVSMQKSHTGKKTGAHQIAANYYYPDHSRYASDYGLMDGFKRSDRYQQERGEAAASLDYYDNDYYYDNSDGISAYQGGNGYNRDRDRYYGGYKGSAKLGAYGDRSGRYKRGEGAAASFINFDNYYYDDSDAGSAYQADLDDEYYYVLVADEYDDDMNGYYDYDYDNGGYKASAKLSGYDDEYYYGHGARLDRYHGSKLKAKQRRNDRGRYGRRGLMDYMEDEGVSVAPAGLILSVVLFIGLIALFVVGYRYKMTKKRMDGKYCKMRNQIINDDDRNHEDQV